MAFKNLDLNIFIDRMKVKGKVKEQMLMEMEMANNQPSWDHLNNFYKNYQLTQQLFNLSSDLNLYLSS